MNPMTVGAGVVKSISVTECVFRFVTTAIPVAVLMATGHSVQIPHSLLDPVRTLTATIAAELGETVEGGDHYRVLFVIGTLLMLMAFLVNLTADLVVKGVRGKQNG